MGQSDKHVFVCTAGSTWPTRGDAERYVQLVATAGLHIQIRNL